VTYLFGPVPSRRLGLSLGVDLIPPKTCSYDCLYCQVGRTTCRTIEPQLFVPIQAVFAELQESFKRMKPDFITFSGSGEPTLYSAIGEAIAFVKNQSDLKVAVLTNGSLLWREEVRKGLLAADVLMPTLSTMNEATFRKVHQPHPDLRLGQVVDGLRRLREDYRGELQVEVMLLAGLNDREEELVELKRVLADVAPDKIQLNTVVRPPADARALSLDIDRMEEVKDFFGEKAEIIAAIPPKHRAQDYRVLSSAVLEMAERRPVRSQDIADGLGLSVEEVEPLVKGLVVKGRLRLREHLGESYYVSGK
jgi:wyosine [tRNA(Phe)-imidazoG37] synthetase (radical SAM superfamily)